MKYNSNLLNKLFNPINQPHTATNNNNNNGIVNLDLTKVLPSNTTSTVNMAAVINNTPVVSNSIVTTTRFTDEYDLKEEIGK